MRGWEGCRGRRYETSRSKKRDLKARVRQECCIGRAGARWPGCTMEICKLEESEGEDKLWIGVGSRQETGDTFRSDNRLEF